ncbi:hypothetical protein ES703_16686 [subsurface metagenome]
MINEATLRMARYYPELIPDTVVTNIAAGAEAAPPILDIRRIAPLFTFLKDIAVERDPQVTIRTRADRLRAAEIDTGTLTGNPGPPPGVMGGITSNNFTLFAKDNLFYNLFSTAIKTAFRSYFGLWTWEPSVACKLLMGLTLTTEERRISDELGIANSVEKGILPIPLPFKVLREYQVCDEVTRGRSLTATTTRVTVDTLYPRVGEFLVLTKIACDPGPALDANNIRITIDRDEDAGYVSDIHAYPLSLDFDLPMFIPALKELRISAIAGIATPTWSIRYTVQSCKMTNLLRCRFGLVTKDELPEPSLWDRVKGGIL